MAINSSKYSLKKNDNIYLYTKGGEYTLDGFNYVGEYHLDGSQAKTGPTVDTKSKILQRYYSNKDHFIYDKVFDFDVRVLSYKNPIYFRYIPKEQVYSTGIDTRYFVEKINDDNSYAIEIDVNQFRSINTKGGIDGSIYTSVSIQWKLTGSQTDIYNFNEQQLLKASSVVPSIVYSVTSFTEYARFTLA